MAESERRQTQQMVSHQASDVYYTDPRVSSQQKHKTPTGISAFSKWAKHACADASSTRGDGDESSQTRPARASENHQDCPRHLRVSLFARRLFLVPLLHLDDQRQMDQKVLRFTSG